MKNIEVFTRITCSGCHKVIEEPGNVGASYVPKGWHRVEVVAEVGAVEFVMLMCRGCFGTLMDAKGAIPPDPEARS